MIARGRRDDSEVSSLTGCPFRTAGFLATGDEMGDVAGVLSILSSVGLAFRCPFTTRPSAIESAATEVEGEVTESFSGGTALRAVPRRERLDGCEDIVKSSVEFCADEPELEEATRI